MVAKDFKCKFCKSVSEHFVDSDCNEVVCEECGHEATWYPSISGGFREDATWLSSVREVVDKDSNKPHVKAFLQEPTRKNYYRWMRGEGIRPVEGNSDMSKPVVTKREMESARHRLTDELCRKRMARNSIEIRG